MPRPPLVDNRTRLATSRLRQCFQIHVAERLLGAGLQAVILRHRLFLCGGFHYRNGCAQLNRYPIPQPDQKRLEFPRCHPGDAAFRFLHQTHYPPGYTRFHPAEVEIPPLARGAPVTATPVAPSPPDPGTSPPRLTAAPASPRRAATPRLTAPRKSRHPAPRAPSPRWSG